MLILIIIGARGTVHKDLEKGTEGDLNQRTSGDYPDCSIIMNSQNTEKSPGDSRRLVVTQAPVKHHQLTLM